MTGLPMRAHLHNTRNSGYANAFAAIASGVRSLDASLGGLGGCPFAPAATGNIATEDLAWMLSRSGGLTWSVEDMITAANWMRSLNLPIDSLLPKAGLFPPKRNSER
jgi:hydroxymethylglutaryl-CoA lyase